MSDDETAGIEACWPDPTEQVSRYVVFSYSCPGPCSASVCSLKLLMVRDLKLLSSLALAQICGLTPAVYATKPRSLLHSKVSLVPKNLSSFESIQDLLPIFEEAMANDTRFVDVIEAPDAVAAMNHLKRLSGKVRSDAVSDRLERVLGELARVAELGMSSMSGKNVALALNSVSHRDGFDSLFAEGIARLRTICASTFAATNVPVCNLHAQSLSMMVNALAKRRMLADAALLADISHAAQRMDPLTYSPQSVAIILNAYSKVARPDSSLFLYMSKVATSLEQAAWEPLSVALLLNSFARSGERDGELFRHFESIIVKLDTRSFTAQNISIIVNAYAKCGYKSTCVFEHMSAAVLAIPPSSCDSLAVANILNAFSRMRMWDAELFAHLSRATLITPTSAFSAQSIGNTLNAHARMGNRDVGLLVYMSHVIREVCAHQGFDQGFAVEHQGFAVGVSFAPARRPRRGGEREEREEREKDGSRKEKLTREGRDRTGRYRGGGERGGGERRGGKGGGDAARGCKESKKTPAREPPAARPRDQVGGSGGGLCFDPQAVANIVNAYARLEMRDEKLFALMEEVIVKMVCSRWDAQSVALVLHAYGKVELYPPRLFSVLSDLAVTLPRQVCRNGAALQL